MNCTPVPRVGIRSGFADPNADSGAPARQEAKGGGAPRGLGDLRQWLRDVGARQCHEAALLRAWARASPLRRAAARSGSALPRCLEEALPAAACDLGGFVRLVSEQAGSDGSRRVLLALEDGNTVESVLLPRAGLCVSTQVGCAVGCVFCMTGRSGLRRQLGSAEIVAQVVLARSLRAVRKVVFMGMGEPAHNLECVMEAIEFLGTDGALGRRNLVFSTVGDRRVFERLRHGPVRPALAISLHSTFAARRAELLPRAPRIDPAELVELGERHARATGYPIQYQWTLLAGVNDGDDELEGIVGLLAGKYAVMNLIPYNPVDGLGFRRPSWERSADLARRLCAQGVLAKLRRSAGQDIEGACGQLRARPVSPAPPAADLASPGGGAPGPRRAVRLP